MDSGNEMSVVGKIFAQEKDWKFKHNPFSGLQFPEKKSSCQKDFLCPFGTQPAVFLSL
jgi:hypothetical protein